MKKIFFFFFTIVIFSNTYSQSKEETTKWLNQNLDYYSIYGNYNIDRNKLLFIETYEATINDGMMMIKQHNSISFEDKYFVIDLKDLTYIKYNGPNFFDNPYLLSKEKEYIGEELKFVGDYIFFTTDSKIANNVYFRFTRPSSNYTETWLKTMDEIVYKENISKRIIKAFSHLVSLYGGNLISKDLF